MIDFITGPGLDRGIDIPEVPTLGSEVTAAYLRELRNRIIAYHQVLAEAINGVILGGFVSDTPSQITANQDNYYPGPGTLHFLSSDAARDITGLVAPAGDGLQILVNRGEFAINIRNQNAGSSAVNRLQCINAVDGTLNAGQSALFVYDPISKFWRQLSF